MRYIGIRSAQGSGIGMIRACTECGATVEQVSRDNHPVDPVFCATCGHKFNVIRMSLKDDEVVRILNEAVMTNSIPPAGNGRAKTKR